MAPPFLTARNLKLSFGGKPLFTDLSLSIHKGERFCLVGRNGCGKSTLLKVLSQIIDFDDGELYIEPGLKIAYLPQDPDLPKNLTPLEFIDKTGVSHYTALTYLDKLQADPNRIMENLSGGEKRRISLADTLCKEPDLLFLDEPTNHLDIPAIEWLENYLMSFQGALIVISHDRAFLERISNNTLWMDRGELRQNKKGYGDFERWTDELAAEEERQAQRLNSKLRLEHEWLLRGVTGRRKRNQGRLRKLHTLRQQKRQIQMSKPGALKISASESDLSSKLVIEAFDISKNFEEKAIVKNFSTRILRGDRIGVIGANGSGKTTLLKLLVGELKPDTGRIKKGPKVDLVYFDQMRDALRPEKSLWENLCPSGGDQVIIGGQARHVMAYLKDFLFEEKQIRGVASILSGGEKNRLALAKALTQESNLLVLDEPTNDLDMDTLDLLVEMLSDYDGTLIIVSHDRDFLDKTVTSIIAVEGDGVVEEYVGGYADYLDQRKTSSSKKLPKKEDAAGKKAPAQTPLPEEPSLPPKVNPRKLTYNQQRLLDTLPGKMADLEREINEIEEKLADPDFYTHHSAQFAKLSERLVHAKKELANAEETWLELSLT